MKVATRPIVSVPIPNLVSGVSQQTPSIRLPSAAESAENCWMSVLTGLNKRSPSKHVAKLTGVTPSTQAMLYSIDQGDAYQYKVVIYDGSIKVYDNNGTAQTVTVVGGSSYITTQYPNRDIRCVTIADNTFIMNRSVEVKGSLLGEDGTNSYTPDGTATTYANLPTAAVGLLDDVYELDDTGEYWQCTEVPGTAAVYAWTVDPFPPNPYGSNDVWPPGLATPLVSDALPTGLGQTAYTHVADDWDDYQGYDYITTKYVSEESVAAVATSYTWVEVPLSSLTTIVNDRLDPAGYASIYVTAGVPNSYYAVYINDVLEASFLTGTNTDAASATEPTTEIATELYDDLVAGGIGTGAYTATLYGSTVVISGLAATDTIDAYAPDGDKRLRVYRGAVDSFSDLSPNEAEGRVLEVKGSLEDNGDDYYVIYNDGIWTETYGYGTHAELNNATMPHVLERQSDGTWTLSPHTWTQRETGDATSNPYPSFVGETLRDMFLYTNRLGFITYSNIILSEAATNENFFRSTLATLVDSDRLDISVMSAANDQLWHAVPFNKELLLCGQRTQSRFSYNQFVGPKNVQIAQTTVYEISPTVPPIGLGNSVYFVDDRPDSGFAKMYEYIAQTQQTNDFASEITDPVPQYLNNDVEMLAGSSTQSVIMAYSRNETDTLVCHRFYLDGGKKVQNSFNKWVFPEVTKFLSILVEGEYLWMLVERGSSEVFLEKISIEDDQYNFPGDYSEIMLDRLVLSAAVTTSYDSGTDKTTITLPYATAETVEVVDETSGVFTEHTTTLLIRTDDSLLWDTDTMLWGTDEILWQVVGDTWTVPGDVTGVDELNCGVAYEMNYKFSEFYMKAAKGQGQLSILDNRFLLRHLLVHYNKTREFTYEVARASRTTKTVTTTLTTPTTGEVRIPLLAAPDTTTITLKNTSPFNSTFDTAEWTASYSPKFKRMA